MKALLLVIVTALALVLVQATAQAAPVPGATIERMYAYSSMGKYERLYELLHPGQQKLVTREAWIRYPERTASLFGYFDSIGIRVVRTYEEPVRLIGVPQRRATAVVFHLSVIVHGGEVEEFPMTRRVVWIGKRWVWVMSNSEVRKWQKR